MTLFPKPLKGHYKALSASELIATPNAPVPIGRPCWIMGIETMGITDEKRASVHCFYLTIDAHGEIGKTRLVRCDFVAVDEVMDGVIVDGDW